MRYDMKYKKLNVEDNESCNLQCEKKCEKLAGVFICCILAFFLLFLSTRNVGLIYCYADELSEDSENTAEDAEQEQQEIKKPSFRNLNMEKSMIPYAHCFLKNGLHFKK